MALPQGINFRGTAAYVDDSVHPNHIYEIVNAPNYPRTTPQGNNVGWETAAGGVQQSNDKDAGNDPRIAGHSLNETGISEYRIDLPLAGTYNIGLAAGYQSSGGAGVAIDLYDTSSSLGPLSTGTTSAAQRFKDATDTEYTQVTWPTSQTRVSKTFATTICRFRLPAAFTNINHVYVESGGAPPTVTLLGQELM